MQCLALFVSLAVLTGVQAWFFSGPKTSEPEWNGLRVTYSASSYIGITIFGYGYNNDDHQLPRDRASAVQQGWIQNARCSDRGLQFRGNRYIKGNDRAVMLLFDDSGHIAGMQAGVPKDTPNFPTGRMRTAFIEEEDSYTATVYFVRPDSICRGGRSPTEYETEGTGTQLLFQIGTNPTRDLFRAPMTEEQIKRTRPWVEGKCFRGMGKHYWYNYSLNMRCEDTLPFFLMYTNGKLNAFGWTFYGDLQSPRYERPGLSAAARTMNEVPKCFEDKVPNLRTMHVFLARSFNSCP